MWISHRKESPKPAFQRITLRQSECALSTQLIKTNYQSHEARTINVYIGKGKARVMNYTLSVLRSKYTKVSAVPSSSSSSPSCRHLNRITGRSIPFPCWRRHCYCVICFQLYVFQQKRPLWSVYFSTQFYYFRRRRINGWLVIIHSVTYDFPISFTIWYSIPTDQYAC